MPKNKIILVLGVIIALLPVLGFPSSWESFFQVVTGLAIVLLSVWATIDRKLTLKAKAQMRQARKSTTPPGVVPQVTDDFGKRVTDFYPKTAPPGRRVSDLNPTIAPQDEENNQGEI